MNEITAPDCVCGLPEQLSCIPSSPIVFDEEILEFRIRFDNGSLEQLMNYCFWCGGRLPLSKRASLFEDISETDLADIQVAISGVQSLSQAIEILGKPDIETYSPNTSGFPLASIFYKARWSTCELCMFSDNKNALSIAILPKRKA